MFLPHPGGERPLPLPRYHAPLKASLRNRMSVPLGVFDDNSWKVRTLLSNSGIACLEGHPGSCAEHPTLGPSEARILSERMYTLGNDAFARFWRSTEPVGRAFATASGRNLDAWIRAWARGEYGPMKTGPGLPVSASSRVSCSWPLQSASRWRSRIGVAPDDRHDRIE